MASILTTTIGNVTTTTQAATLLVAADADRKGLFINATGNMMIGNSNVTNTANCFRILANTHIQLGVPTDFNAGGVFSGDLYFIATATSTCYALSLK